MGTFNRLSIKTKKRWRWVAAIVLLVVVTTLGLLFRLREEPTFLPSRENVAVHDYVAACLRAQHPEARIVSFHYQEPLPMRDNLWEVTGNTDGFPFHVVVEQQGNRWQVKSMEVDAIWLKPYLPK